jgi:hypothetical protein
MKRNLQPGCPTHSSFCRTTVKLSTHPVKVVFWQQKIEKDKMQRKKKEEKGKHDTTYTLYLYPRINK